MTPDQLALKELLDSAPLAWVQLNPNQRSLLRKTLRPDGEFTPEQRELLQDRYLPITTEQLAQAQRLLLPRRTQVNARADADGAMWLPADLLTDCMEVSDTYHAIVGLLAQLPITLKPADDFPAPSPLDI
ncbi:hypothetical protein H6F75_22425 [Nodosilinea sp. FACHB-131]|uniref:hypothetical protein n=1 Tax=Cyanophyceae TaxID=3028117 RepID=UPI0016856820|nr:hypothetical protein [Nodosilinea sp. FACHB-131]MBD1876246.1 hypothetical protein [Nodosilinea sp. FACHB-131]